MNIKGRNPLSHAEILWEIEQIKRLKARYFLFQDENRWDEWAALFSADCEIADPLEPGRTHRSGQSIAKRTAETAGNSTRNHRGAMPDIELVDERSARGTWALFCATHLIGPDGAPIRVDIFGYYHDEYRKEADGQWRIRRMRYSNAMTSGTPTDELL